MEDLRLRVVEKEDVIIVLFTYIIVTCSDSPCREK